MNILIVNKYFFVSGGPERYMFSVMDLLEHQGHKVVPLALRLEQNQPSPYTHYFLPSPVDEEASHFRDFSLRLADKIRLTARAIYYPTARRRVAEIVRREKIEVVYLLNICNYISPSVIAGAQEAGARVVMRLSDFNFVCASYHLFCNGQMCTACLRGMRHAIKYHCMRGSLSLSVVRVLAMKLHQIGGIYQKVDAFIAPSKFMAETLIEFGMPAERVYYVPSFVDLDTYQPRFEPGEYVLYFGRLDVDKGVDVLLRAWHLLGEKAPPLRIVGAGEAEQELKRLADALPVANVQFQGFVGKEELLELIRGAAFVVGPSLWPDNSPMAVYEAMACGKAVIGSRLGGLLDQIEEGSTGVLVPAGDAKALAQAVQRLWDNPIQVRAMGEAGRQRMEIVFSPAKHLTALENIFAGTAGHK
jgi:glycosyltransferase involved in cell wall biosynthesis